MPAASSDFFTKVGISTATTLAAPGHTIAGTTFNVVSTSNWPTTTGAIFAVDTYNIATGLRVPGSYTEWEGVVANSTTITGAVLRYGTDQNYPAGSTTRVYIPVTNSRENRLVDGILVHADQTGALLPAAVQTALGTGNLANTGYNALGFTPNTVTNLGNRSQKLVFNGQDLTGVVSPGMRIRTTRTVLPQTQVTSLDGINQSWSKAAPAGMTFTNNFTVYAKVKLSSYPAARAGVMSRYNGTNGWFFTVEPTGQVVVQGISGTANEQATSYQSIPLNKLVTIVATLDMSGNLATVYIDDISVPYTYITNTAGTALTQAGNLEVGSYNGGNFFPGKIAQAAVFSTILTQATIRSLSSQGLTGTETSLISAYSFNGNGNDLNTTNANNLTANNAAGYVSDSPFSNGVAPSVTAGYDFHILQAATYTGGNTELILQSAEGNSVPTSGGVSSVVYSSQKVPFGFPLSTRKWELETILNTTSIATGSIASAWGVFTGSDYTFPIGIWKQRSSLKITGSSSTPSTFVLQTQWDTASPTFSRTGQHVKRPPTAAGFDTDTHRHVETIEVAIQATYKMYGAMTSGSGTQTAYVEAYGGSLVLENAYL